MTRRHAIDPTDLGLPAGAYAQPDPCDVRYPGSEHAEIRVTAYLRGTAGVNTLEPSERDWVRDEVVRLTDERRVRAIEFFDNRVPRRYQAAAHDDPRVADWVRGYTLDRDNTPSLLIVGPTGTGKTHLGWSVIKGVAHAAGENRWKASTAADLYASLRPRTGRDTEAEFEKAADAPLLYLDDIAAAKPTEWNEEITYRLVNHRYEQCLPAIFTTNVPPAQMRDILGERIASRLTEMCDRIVLRGDDRRKGGGS
ncbi:ATP-binding protein [Embleya sp. NPDC001921]